MRRKLKSEGQFSKRPAIVWSRDLERMLPTGLTVTVPLSSKVLRLVSVVRSILHRLIDLLHRLGVDDVAWMSESVKDHDEKNKDHMHTCVDLSSHQPWGCCSCRCTADGRADHSPSADRSTFPADR